MIDFILQKFMEIIAIDSPTGYTDNAKKYVLQELKNLGYQPKENKKGCVFCTIGGSGKQVMLSAHFDTLGAMVAEIKGDGRLRLTRLGSLRAENTEAENCKVITRDGAEVEGTFQLINASVHVNPKYAETARTFATMEVVLDEEINSKGGASAHGVQVGDIVCFDPRAKVTKSGYVKSRFIDDKMSVAILLGVAKYVKENNVELDGEIMLFLTSKEEIGLGATHLPKEVDEILCVDMGCVGEGLNCTERQCSICVNDSSAPTDYEMTSKLIKLAKDNCIDYALDVYPFYSSDADSALSAGYDTKHALIGQGVYASHGYERTHVDGIEATYDLILKYISK